MKQKGFTKQSLILDYDPLTKYEQKKHYEETKRPLISNFSCSFLLK